MMNGLILCSWVWSSTRRRAVQHQLRENRQLRALRQESQGAKSAINLGVAVRCFVMDTPSVKLSLALVKYITDWRRRRKTASHQSGGGSKPTDALTSVSSDRRLFPNPAQEEEIIQLKAKSPRMALEKIKYWLWFVSENRTICRTKRVYLRTWWTKPSNIFLHEN